MKTMVFRLHPEQDLFASIEQLVQVHNISAGCVLAIVGSLQEAVLRFADQEDLATLSGKFEIVSLSGTLSTNGSHLHISISDSWGQTYGGHLVEGCRIYTTAEIVIGIFSELIFERQHDPASGYPELVVIDAPDQS